MNHPDLRPATLEDAILVAAAAREIDAAECRLLVGMDPVEAAVRTMRTPGEAWYWGEPTEPCAVLGVSHPNVLAGPNVIWMITTPAIERHRIKFLRASRYLMRELALRHGALETEVFRHHHACLRWLAWLGFTVEPPRPYGVAGALFHHVHIGA